MLMALLLYGHEFCQARRAAAEQTKMQERAALRSSRFGQLGTSSDAGTDSGAGSGRLPIESQAKVEGRRRHHKEDSLLAMLNRPQVRARPICTCCMYPDQSPNLLLPYQYHICHARHYTSTAGLCSLRCGR